MDVVQCKALPGGPYMEYSCEKNGNTDVLFGGIFIVIVDGAQREFSAMNKRADLSKWKRKIQQNILKTYRPVLSTQQVCTYLKIFTNLRLTAVTNLCERNTKV